MQCRSAAAAATLAVMSTIRTGRARVAIAAAPAAGPLAVRRAVRAGVAIAAALVASPFAAPRAVQAQAPALLPPGHWAAEAVWTLHALGALDGTVDRGRRRLTIGEATRLIRGANDGGDPTAAAVLAHARERLDRDFPSTRGWASRGPRMRLEGAVGAAAVVRGDEVGTRTGRLSSARDANGHFIPVSEAPSPPRPDGVRAEPDGFAALGDDRFALVGEARPTTNGDVVLAAYAAAQAGPVSLWAGRSAPGYGPGRRGSQVLSRDREVLGAGLATARPFRLPWFLDGLGDIQAETFLGVLERNREIDHPLLWGMRASATPHPRFGFGASRAAMFGGEGNEGSDFRHFLEILVLERSPGLPAENQTGALDAWFRPPLGGLPLVAWVEWGSDDTAGGLFQVPGIVAGLGVPAWPGLAPLGVAVEATWLAGQGGGNGPWYWHGFFPAGWAVKGEPLGHPLGGEGTELLLGLDLRLRESTRISLDLFRRERGSENLYAPVWEGSSNGAELKVDFQPTRLGEISLLAYVEEGDGWTRGGGTLAARVRF